MIITVGREHGSNGHLIAHALAQQLQYRCFDKEIVDKAAETSNFSKEVLSSYDEKRVAPYIAPALHYIGMNEGFRLNMEVAAAQFQAIRDL
ncbi:MAG: cytidylate kinase family protein, partial [Oscillospiraceae bacterium]|nr:cytidylate kinase family protein [Oscillospiraceae bacterium]